MHFFVGTALLICSVAGLAQDLTVGPLPAPTGSFGPGVTVIDFSAPATREGSLTSATFRWSAAPCPGAVKIKVGYRGQDLPPFHLWHFVLSEERGPFDVFQPLETVALIPPVKVGPGYQIAISSVTSCGGPVSGGGPGPPLGGSLVVQGEWKDQLIQQGPFAPSSSLSVSVQGGDDSVVLLKNRFRATLIARDPRTGITGVGRGITQADRFGYFSLPEFTGDADFPEVIVKMADATALPLPFGGSFWVFYSSLTDLQYTLTVTDQVSGKVRTYSNVPGGANQLCGGADTSAFPP
ncbi:MAG: hypothetical protein ABI682_06425 [Acidobacteriota bacterium]